ncbi:MAG: histidine phosphatase family protein [Leptolyngbyaceae cyanobacterium]
MGSIASRLPSLLLGLLATCGLLSCGPSPEGADSPAPTPTEETTPIAEPMAETPPTRPESAPTSLTVTDAVPPSTPEELWQQLQQPADTLYVVLLRHALAPGTGDPENFQLGDCSTQRNLSEAGREQAVAIGQAFRDRGVAVRQILSSQWCRCLETAELMDVGQVEAYPELNSFFRDRSTSTAQTTAVKEYLVSEADAGGVIIMVTHQVNITGLTDIFPQSGEAVVVQVETDQLTQIGQFRPAL